MSKKNGFVLARSAKVNTFGFTLIELLVSIAILAILSAVAMVVYNGVTAKVRDGQRFKDLQTIKQALELYRSDIHNYPKTSDFVLNSNTTLSFGSSTYLSPVPLDTDSSRNYYYLASPSSCDNATQNTTCTGFILCGRRESTSNSNDLPACATLNNCGGNCNIGISSQ